MRDDEEQEDWAKLITINHIETATRNVQRLSIALQFATMATYLQTLSEEEADTLQEAFVRGNPNEISQIEPKVTYFMESACKANATFALHMDMLQHCNEVVGLSFAEHLGGDQGYDLLLACVKSSLLFSFVNGSTSYAPFVTELLYAHSQAGIFHQHLKKQLFSSPHRDFSLVNVGLDTQRELDHKDAQKAFRARATCKTVVPRMSLVDTFSEVQSSRSSLTNTKSKNIPEKKPLWKEICDMLFD